MQENKRVIHILIAICLLFFTLISYLTYFELFTRNTVVNNSYNKRLWEKENETERGNIYDRNGVLLAKNVMSGDNSERVYPYGSLYSHVIGYNSRTYGRSLIEAEFNNYLLNSNELSSVFDLKYKLTGAKKSGNNLYLTINHKLQAKAKELLAGKTGAVIAINPKTGEILAMVSKPDFDPNEKNLLQNWKDLVDAEDSPFLPRTIQGLYAPGSTFKIVISSSAIENGMENLTLDDSGSIVIDGQEISNYNRKAHGIINLKDALTLSSNTFFSQLGVKLGNKNLKYITDKMGMNKSIPFQIPVKSSLFPYESMSKSDMAAVGIGQGKILVSPLHMALITSSIANNGVMMKPILVNKAISSNGNIVETWNPDAMNKVMQPETAQKVKKMMIDVVNKGTGKKAKLRGINVAGKTGTAENELTTKENDKEHAWFVGFAPAENPKIVTVVILEYNGSTGGTAAAPVARDLMESYLKKQ